MRIYRNANLAKGLFCLTWLGLLLNFSCLPATSGEPVPRASETSSRPVTGQLTELVLGQNKLQIELACTSSEQQRGLMFRHELPENQGMLFVFAQAQDLSFWMKNTYLPLSIAYIDAAGRIVDMQDMQPMDETTHPSARPARFALEVNQGWFKRHAVKLGDQIRLDSFCAHR